MAKMTKDEFTRAEELYRAINARAHSIAETSKALFADDFDPMMATAVKDQSSAYRPNMIVISQEEYDNVLEYARFVGVGVDMTYVHVNDDEKEEEENFSTTDNPALADGEWAVIAILKDGEMVSYPVECNGQDSCLYWWPTKVTYHLPMFCNSCDVVTATLYHNGSIVETFNKVGRGVHTTLFPWNEEW